MLVANLAAVIEPDLEEAPSLETKPRRGLALLLDVFIAPQRAFATIAETSEWLPAFAATLASGVAATVLTAPALRHLAPLVLPHVDPAGHALDAATRARQVDALIVLNAMLTWLVAPLFMWACSAMVFALVSRTGLARLLTYFALAVNTWLPVALGQVVSGIVIRLHDPTSFNSFAQLALAVPLSLASFAPHDSERAIAFLSNFDIFLVWSLVLLAYGLRAIGHVRLVPALATTFTIGLVLALLLTPPSNGTVGTGQ